MSLSYHAFILRIRRIAMKALEAYCLEESKLKFINYSGNGLYQVTVTEKLQNESFAPGRYTLRLHQPDYMRSEYISSELEWLSAMTDAGIDVPQPFRNLDGEWITVVEGEHNRPSKRNCTLISWTEGRLLNKVILPKHFISLGRITGKMHEQSLAWKKPKGFKRPHWDWEGLFGDGFDYGVPAQDARNAIPKNHQEAFNEILNRVHEASEQMGKGKKVYGLIHADLGVDGNVAFRGGEARPFDFDDCGFGYWIFDLGVALAHYMCDVDSKSPKMKDALIEGYMESSPLPESNLEYLDLFIGARFAQLMFFFQGGALRYPQVRDEAKKEVNNYAKYLKRILKKL